MVILEHEPGPRGYAYLSRRVYQLFTNCPGGIHIYLVGYVYLGAYSNQEVYIKQPFGA